MKVEVVEVGAGPWSRSAEPRLKSKLPGTRTRYLESIWSLVRRWARANGHEVVSTYGVKGVAPT